MGELTTRAYFWLCLAAGQVLRAARYSTARILDDDHGRRHVRKHRRFYAPLLIWIGNPLVRLLDTGVKVLPQLEWEERERRMYQGLYRASIEVDPDGVLLLPLLGAATLAALLEDPELAAHTRTRAIGLATGALVEFHRRGFTHGDAMAENVLIDLDGNAARWFDFETVHDPRRPMSWRRADDVRALLVTCLTRTAADERAGTLASILDVYADEDVTRVLATSFTSVWRRALTFHLAQAPMSLEIFREIGGLLRARRLSSQQRRSSDRSVPRLIADR